MEKGMMIFHWPVCGSFHLTHLRVGKNRATFSFISARARLLLFLRTSSQSKTKQKYWEIAQAIASELRIKAQTRYSGEISLKKKNER